MKTKFLLGVGILLSAGLLTARNAADEPKKENARNYDNLAQNVVTRSARIKEGDLVQISGHFKDAALLEALAVQTRKQGGEPLVVAGSDRLTRRLIEDVPAKFDSQKPNLALKLAETLDVYLTVESTDEEELASLPTERLSTIAKANASVDPLMRKRNIRTVGLGNGLYPTASRAKQYGLSEEELAKIFWEGLNVDATKLQSTGAELQKLLSNGTELHLTNANGTDLKVKIEKRPVFVSDGNLTPEKLKKGGAAVQTWLPAGEVYVAPTAGSAEGKVVIDRMFYEGKEVTGVTLTLKSGKVTELTAKSGGERLLKRYQEADAGKEQFAVLDVGINPNVRIPKGSKMLVYMASGMVSVWTGNNVWAGGDNNASISVGGFIPGSTLKLDGKVIVENGELKL